MSKTTVIPVGGVTVEMITEGDAICRMTNNGKDWEPGTRSIWGGLIRPGDTMIDVGAYTGIYAIAAAMIGAKVIAIEPHPANFQRLRTNAALNSARIEMIEAAASDRVGRRALHSKNGIATITDIASLECEQVTAVSVNTVRIDDLRLCARVGLIKIDVEHHEARVLKGAIRTISSHHPAIMVEVLTQKDADSIEAVLYGLGYASDIVMDKRNVFYRFNP